MNNFIKKINTFIKIWLVLFLIYSQFILANTNTNNVEFSNSYPIKDGYVNIITILEHNDINYKYDAILAKLSIDNFNYSATIINKQNFYFANGQVFYTDNAP